MSDTNKKQDESEQIPLLRGGTIVSSLTGGFGLSLRETKLTTLLGYLIALKPEPFIKKFRFTGQALSVSLETVHARDRSDILVETTNGTGIIEAKIGATNPFEQSLTTSNIPEKIDIKSKGSFDEYHQGWNNGGEHAPGPVFFLDGDIRNYIPLREVPVCRQSDHG